MQNLRFRALLLLCLAAVLLAVPLLPTTAAYAIGPQKDVTYCTNAGHGFVPSGGPISPTLLQLWQMVGDFFDKHLSAS